MTDFYALLRTLCDLYAPSSLEDAVRQYLIELLLPAADGMKTDRVGNLICYKKGKKSLDTPILLSAHMDEVGFLVTDITADGYLKFGTVGGVRPAILPSKRLYFPEEKLYGVISAKPIHLYRDEAELLTPTKLDGLWIDIGAKDREQAESAVSIGSIATFDRAYLPYLEANGVIRSAALDDRLGCAMLAELVLGNTPEYDLTVAFTVQEECGCRGAAVLASCETYASALAVEGTTASDLPDAEGADAVCFQKKGGVLSLFDGATLYDRALVREAMAVLENAGIPVQTKRRLAGGNDASALQRKAGAGKVLSFSAPVRYLHSPTSTAAKCDLDAMRAALPHLIGLIGKKQEEGTL